ncbi:epoxide hydrolase [Saccharothrix longispora]|uniref:epoxide hydrolase family protein n=1 Tax=Saccharothrix longispora TaxID=33920 RepID=UPI0028FD64BB|nr:epoxide hydrolase [Saccharothrix longispora]MDU0294788.1 epoxide hydrolase [Saccharothrix longispora]
MVPFRIEIPESALEDLRKRIDETRWPTGIPGAGWSRGVPPEYLRELAEYWRHDYDWRAAERRLNQFPQFIDTIDGVDIHFLHVRSPEADATPVIMTHGWPGTIAEFVDVIGPLTDPRRHGGDPADACHVVVPSLPGHGFSGPVVEAGWDIGRVARAWAELMRRLGYDRYVAQGGDWGKVTSLRLGEVDPEHVAGVHINMLVTFPPPDDPTAVESLDEVDLGKLEHGAHFLEDGTGYSKLQSTRPQTLAYALTDSPVGQLAWIAEKYKEWTNAVTGPEETIKRDDLLTHVTIYWLTRTAGSSAQLYYETTRTTQDFMRVWGGPWPLAMPVGVAVFPNDATRPIRSFAERALPTLSQWTEFDKGGHFAAMEAPELLVDDVRRFIRSLRADPH